MQVKEGYFRALAYYYRAKQADDMKEFGLCVALHQEAVSQAKAAVKLLSKSVPEETQEVSCECGSHAYTQVEDLVMFVLAARARETPL